MHIICKRKPVALFSWASDLINWNIKKASYLIQIFPVRFPTGSPVERVKAFPFVSVKNGEKFVPGIQGFPAVSILSFPSLAIGSHNNVRFFSHIMAPRYHSSMLVCPNAPWNPSTQTKWSQFSLMRPYELLLKIITFPFTLKQSHISTKLH